MAGRSFKLRTRPRRFFGKEATVAKAKERDGYRCRVCGFEHALHGHHIVPVRLGGEHDLSNIITLCPNHHALAHAGLLTAAQMRECLDAPPAFRPLTKAASAINFRRGAS